jgi:Ca2+:H+ antiporter
MAYVNSALRNFSLMSLHRLQLFSFSVGQQKHFIVVNPSRFPVYASYLVFQLFSHKALYDDDNEDIEHTKRYEGENPFKFRGLRNRKNIMGGETVLSPSSTRIEEAPVLPSTRPEGVSFAASTEQPLQTTPSTRPEGATLDVERGSHSAASAEQPLMSLTVCLWLLVVVTVVRALLR